MTSTNVSSVVLAEKYAREHFDLTLPMTAQELKNAFRKASKELHPDKGGDPRKFDAMKCAYDFLVTLKGMEYVYGERSSEGVQLATADGTPLYELGLGLGPTKNGRDCERCQHKGFTEEKRYDWGHYDVCTKCDEFGNIVVPTACRPCGGTGKFTQERSQKTVDCRVCGGSGKGRPQHKSCPDCEGVKRSTKRSTYYSKCYKCNGTGEIELFNALMPKMRIMNVKR